MAVGKKIAGILFNAAIFIGLEVAALSLLGHNGQVQNFFLAKALHGFMAKTWGASESVRYYFSLKGVNEALSQENFQLSQRLKTYESEEEKKRMEALAGSFTDIGEFHYMPASIVKISRNKQHNYLIIGQGAEDGVQPHSGIISAHGVIGIVDAVSKHYAYAISFMNSDFSVSTRLGREGPVGPMVWDGKSSSGAILRQIPLQYRFEPGDTVYTSGFSSIFPADIPLGTVGESRIVNGATYEIAVSLLQDFGALRYVTLVSNKGKEEIDELEEREVGQ